MRKANPDQHATVIKLLNDKGEGGVRDTTQLDKCMNFLEQFSQEVVLSRKRGYVFCTKRQFIARMIFVEGYSRKRAKNKWEQALKNKDTPRATENGKTVLGIRKALEVDITHQDRVVNKFEGDQFRCGQSAAQSMLSGSGPSLQPSMLKSFAGEGGKCNSSRMLANEGGGTTAMTVDSDSSSGDGESQDGDKQNDSGDDSDLNEPDGSSDGTSDSEKPAKKTRSKRKTTPQGRTRSKGEDSSSKPKRPRASPTKRNPKDEDTPAGPDEKVLGFEGGRLDPMAFVRELNRFKCEIKRKLAAGIED